MPEFQYTYLLYALVLLPVMALLFFFALAKKKKAIKKIGDPALVQQLLVPYRKQNYSWKFLILFFVMGLLVLSLANMRTAAGVSGSKRNGVDVMIALDVSKSMLAKDIQPNRLERAKQVVNKLIDRLQNDRIGIVVFAGKAYLQMPLTADHSAAKMYLGAAGPDAIPTQGTVISEALKMCYAGFNSREKKYKTIVLISDGEDHDEEALAIADQLASSGVIIHTIGIGSAQGSPIPDEATGQMKTDAEGNTVISRLNEEELASLAKKGGGIYQLYTNSDQAVGNIINQIGRMDQRAVKDDALITWKSYFQYLLGAALLLLLLEFFITERRNMKGRKLKPAVAGLLLFLNANAFAQADKESIRQGNDAYKRGDYAAAEANYRKASTQNPNNATAYYNLGNAQYRSKKTDESVASYDNAIKLMTNNAQKSDAFYNKGVVLQNSDKLEDCILAYKNALILNPNHEEARQNLQKALRKQKENQDKQKQDNKNQDQKPKPQSSKLNQKEAEEKLKALMQQEKNLQDKMHKQNAQAPDQPEKDW
ncbi:MAG: VWA domain-containing protein [Ferruginibacter sp.]